VDGVRTHWSKQDGVGEEQGVQEDEGAAIVGFFELPGGSTDSGCDLPHRV